MKHYIGIPGTNATDSTNLKLLQYMQQHYAEKVSIELVNLGTLPLFYKTPDHSVPAEVTELAKKISAADGVIIATPEYDHAVPAMLSSALAWLSYFIEPLAGKPVLIIGASYGALGTSRAQAQLRQILDSPEVRAFLMPNSEFMVGHSLSAFDEQGNLTNQTLVKRLDGLMQDFDIFVDMTKKLTHTLAQHRQDAANVDWEHTEN
ncbi:NADPH-dependent FMN reductase [Agrilactobacillus fermenti]|uniref:NADPH-dependent FMN reductase n=1 Tax=Agrilactobacillus fermenti TaxID=2586909 RepID=UPI001E501829|nr:NAD(P)H-dependent oxidoreductase [Agrilactobacillus fermenti]MCD2255197.1 NAD(P)H-dependent oxidoreductase [Agrilactobacillus fermenti]